MKYTLFILIILCLLIGGTVSLTRALEVSVDSSSRTNTDVDVAALQARENNDARASTSGSSFFSLEKSSHVYLETDLDVSLEKETRENETSEIVHVQLSNGRRIELKIMPETASATALAQIGLHVCSEENNCTIILKEVGEGNEIRAEYEIRAHKRARLFGIFNTRLNVSAEVDAETGKVIKSHWPWWAFLTTSAETSASS